ncbi:c-type cytochrome [Gluconobacter sphaericus]|uniref:Cytochrome c-552 n=1 Tax=Gluconobacter sphaericus NBRC 12467 TaxID=1307951 RepID=A0AA37SDX9_9PROT|nr:cytochrome c [Gluconobacter sphaericus]GBR51140.1 cytochrome c class I [Gluconobacter sphaericus NBRC 12467]GEB41951.1 cytochrome c-552 [Gluconobacter sphaericus NBRC 12467]GLQ84092.1 cytochrome c-552 [Gluconobacter sphaericus NBRC 12467]
MTTKPRFRIMLSAFLGLMPLMASRVIAADGAALYQGKCAMCHGPAAAGRPGTFPPLAGRVGQIAGNPDGKAYLAAVLVNGLHGPITVNGESYKGFMPSFRTLSDEDIAAVLAYVSTLGNSTAPVGISAQDVTSVRAAPMDAAAVQAKRAALQTAGVIP